MLFISEFLTCLSSASPRSCLVIALGGLYPLAFASTAQRSFAQVIPDRTLPQNSLVTDTLVTGGTKSGTNLFHSFQDFSVKGSILFVPDPDILNIITRVTGNQRSLIDGILAVNGRANFFLINPNGITFGQNAQLGINGSFFASTAQSVKFSDGSEFSAKSPQTPLLTMSAPIGLQFGTRPASIEQTGSQLLVPPGQTLALLGGDVLVNGGSLIANSGKISLKTVDRPEYVSLSEPSNLRLGNLEISNQAQLDASGLGGGRIEIDAGNVVLSNARIASLTVGDQDGQGISIRSNQFRLQDGAQIAAITTGSGKGGNIDISATESFRLRGIDSALYQRDVASLIQTGVLDLNSPTIAITNSTFGQGQAGNISIVANQIQFENGIGIGGTTLQAGQVGAVNLQAKDIRIASGSIVTSTFRGSTGAAGNINIQADRLTVREGAAITTSTFGRGNSGKIDLNVKDTITLADTPKGSVIQTAIGSNAFGDNQAQAGNISIKTGRLLVSDGAGISAGSGGASGTVLISPTGGKAGDLEISATELIDVSGISEVLANGTQTSSYLSTDTGTSSQSGNLFIQTPILRVRDGANISVGSLGFGQAGTLTINATRIEVSGRKGDLPSRIQASTGKLSFSSIINPKATSDAGDLNLNVRELSIRDGATVTVENIGSGKAGNLNINADRIFVNNGSSIDARTGTAGGGNVNLRSQLILLRRGSNIQTDANLSNGGNITINTGLLLAVPTEDSNITATAQGGRGGNINIAAQGIFGLQQSRSLTSNSDITASSRIGLDGTVTLTTFGTEPNVSTDLPGTQIISSDQISQTCTSLAKTGQFVITARGGLEPPVSEVVQSTPVWMDERASTHSLSLQKSMPEMIEATGWVKRADGEIMLVSESTHRQILASCLLPSRAAHGS
ncbi:two-partner secretion domain-containing protein [Leptolyngbya sp. GGD]|uniref:two-partner secretion domain-containing protein n=1 Tax=Leptolyngbya sp. GGD TaxID=2997907 RepID=UPI00227A611F|nr:filamentous hemagglutinin N-terminal domain-containing protein [Leptolyngbya sp. GGD]MCY6489681.1 filamentous hemagglutinin N-terminal domain-containing protein [Leptolyngbya sp. GGD]